MYRIKLYLRAYFGPLVYAIQKVLFKLTLKTPEIIVQTRFIEGLTIKFAVSSERTLHRAKNEFKFEPELIDLILSISKVDQKIAGGFIDVGANQGTYSLLAASLGHEVLSFEPSFVNSYTFERNVQLNSLESKITNLKIALSNHTGIGELVHHRATEAGNSGAVIDYSYFDKSAPEIYKEKVFVTTLDSILQYYEFVPIVLKIDTDGNEISVLQGATKTLQAPSLHAILVEVSSKAERDEVIEFLLTFRFKLSEIVSKSSTVFVCNLIFKRI